MLSVSQKDRSKKIPEIKSNSLNADFKVKMFSQWFTNILIGLIKKLIIKDATKDANNDASNDVINDTTRDATNDYNLNHKLIWSIFEIN